MISHITWSNFLKTIYFVYNFIQNFETNCKETNILRFAANSLPHAITFGTVVVGVAVAAVVVVTLAICDKPKSYVCKREKERE